MTIVVSNLVIVRSIFFVFIFINLFLLGHACYSKAYGPLFKHFPPFFPLQTTLNSFFSIIIN